MVLVALFSVGCGSSRDDFYIGNTYYDDPVVFDGITTTPSSIVMVDDGVGLFPTPVTLETRAHFTPIGGASYSVVLDNDEVAYTLSAPNDPYGNSLSAPVTVDNTTGVVSFVNDGSNATITTSYTYNGVTHTDVVDVKTFYLDGFVDTWPVPYPAGDILPLIDIPVMIDFTDFNGNFYELESYFVSHAGSFSFALKAPVDGVTIDPNTGSLTFDPLIFEGDSVDVIVTYEDTTQLESNHVPSGETFEVEIEMTVAGPI